LFASLLIIFIKSPRFKTITSKSVIALTVAVLSSSFNKAISQKISQGFNSAILFHQIDIATFHLFKIYHSQFEFSHSIIINSQFEYFLCSQLFIIESTISLLNQ